MSKKIDIIRLLIIFLITMILMTTVSTTIYGVFAKPEFYAHFMNLGNKYLTEGNYEEAILAFDKAIKIEGKSTQARIGLAKGSIGIDDTDTAVKMLKEVQIIDFENTDLLNEIIDILKDVDPNAAYEILMNYVNKKGEKNIGRDIKKLLESSKEAPQIPTINPPSGTYIQPFAMRLESGKVRIGHVFYYTLDGSVPTDKSTPYKGSIKINENTHVKLIGYNPAGETTEVFEADYIIDSKIMTNIKTLIQTSESERDAVSVGTEVGNCVDGAKEELNASLEKGEKLLNKNAVSVAEGNAMIRRLNDALETFRKRIITPTDRNALENEISRAKTLVERAVEGTQVGQYRSGAKTALNAAVSVAEGVFKDVIAHQEDIDNAKKNLTNAINAFEAKKITEIDKIISDTGAKIGPVTVSLLWNTTDDLDLHVTSPKGDTINYSNKRGSSGGYLDVDRQVTSYVENPVENIYWNNPPHGTYTVKVNMYSKRSSGTVSFRVRTIVNGEAKIYNMTIDNGTENVCTFTY